VISLGLGEEEPLSKYSSFAAGMHYLHKRNVRMMGEWGWDFQREQMRFVLGTMVGF
jgi:hypothetical protein